MPLPAPYMIGKMVLSKSRMSVTHKLDQDGAGCCIPAQCSAQEVVQQAVSEVCQLTLTALNNSHIMQISYIECLLSSEKSALASSNGQNFSSDSCKSRGIHIPGHVPTHA